MEGLPSAVGSVGRGVPPRLILNLEVLFLAFGGGREERTRSVVCERGAFGKFGPRFSTSPWWMSSMISFKSSSLSSGPPRS